MSGKHFKLFFISFNYLHKKKNFFDNHYCALLIYTTNYCSTYSVQTVYSINVTIVFTFQITTYSLTFLAKWNFFLSIQVPRMSS